ncbi:hypothetical protein [Streptomyces sp. NPDC086766]|uniref:hypothetical protein n=1 Tax=Streptomyces sp. NPDC086766 TaxID=3365754 RepID=UPI003802EF18
MRGGGQLPGRDLARIELRGQMGPVLPGERSLEGGTGGNQQRPAQNGRGHRHHRGKSGHQRLHPAAADA